MSALSHAQEAPGLILQTTGELSRPLAGAVHVCAALEGGLLRIEVDDGGTNGAVVRRTRNPDRGGGFGLNIIDALALRWGVKRGRGIMVWVELDC